MTRYHCEFKNCCCRKYISNNNICDCCNHAKVWHSRTNNNESKYGKSQFMSSRKKARQPFYVNEIIYPTIYPRMFIPQQIPVVEAVEIDPNNFCPEICALPV